MAALLSIVKQSWGVGLAQVASMGGGFHPRREGRGGREATAGIDGAARGAAPRFRVEPDEPESGALLRGPAVVSAPASRRKEWARGAGMHDGSRRQVRCMRR